MIKCSYCEQEFLIKDLFRLDMSFLVCKNCIDRYFPEQKGFKHIKSKQVKHG